MATGHIPFLVKRLAGKRATHDAIDGVGAFCGAAYVISANLSDAGLLATTALIGGTAALMANLLSVSIVITVFVVRDDISPDLARAVMDVDGAGHVLAATGLPTNEQFFMWPFLLVLLLVVVISVRFGFARRPTTTPAAVAAAER